MTFLYINFIIECNCDGDDLVGCEVHLAKMEKGKWDFKSQISQNYKLRLYYQGQIPREYIF